MDGLEQMQSCIETKVSCFDEFVCCPYDVDMYFAVISNLFIVVVLLIVLNVGLCSSSINY